jgi:hypothetical protein
MGTIMDYIYRVGIEGWGGFYYEKFYSSQKDAEKAFDALVDVKRKAEDTASDEEIEGGYGDVNFADGMPINPHRDGKEELRRVYYCYWHQCGGEVEEWDTSTDFITLKKIQLERGDVNENLKE